MEDFKILPTVLVLLLSAVGLFLIKQAPRLAVCCVLTFQHLEPIVGMKLDLQRPDMRVMTCKGWRMIISTTTEGFRL